MFITYLLDMTQNSLYSGKYALAGRFHGYGQHTFIRDLVTALARAGHDVHLMVRGLDRFPLAGVLERHDGVTVSERPPPVTDVLLVDEAPDDLLATFDEGVPAVKLVHDAFSRASAYAVARCARFICMSGNALARQAPLLGPGQGVLIHQGVDLRRFRPRTTTGAGHRPRLLMYCRLDSGREKTLISVLENVDFTALSVYVVGDGPGFWEVEDRFGDDVILMNHVPNRSLPLLLHEMDIVISLGRGVMEAMAAGLPVLCAGYGYAGPVTAETIEPLLYYNLTGAGCDRDPRLVMADVRTALVSRPGEMRTLAEAYVSVDLCAERIGALLHEVRSPVTNGVSR